MTHISIPVAIVETWRHGLISLITISFDAVPCGNMLTRSNLHPLKHLSILHASLSAFRVWQQRSYPPFSIDNALYTILTASRYITPFHASITVSLPHCILYLGSSLPLHIPFHTLDHYTVS